MSSRSSSESGGGYELYAPCLRKVDNPATQEFPQQGMHREHPRAVVREESDTPAFADDRLAISTEQLVRTIDRYRRQKTQLG